MRLDELKKGFWGYKRESVYRYITVLEEEMSRKLEEQAAEAKKESQKAGKRIYELEEALRLLREENEVLSRDQMHVARTLLEAQKFSGEIKEETLRYEKEARKEIEDVTGEQMRKLGEYSKKIGKLRVALKELLEDMDGEAEKIGQEIEELKEQAPASSLRILRKDSGDGHQESA